MYPWTPEESVESSAAGVIGRFVWLDVGDTTEPRLSARAAVQINSHRANTSSPWATLLSV